MATEKLIYGSKSRIASSRSTLDTTFQFLAETVKNREGEKVFALIRVIRGLVKDSMPQSDSSEQKKHDATCLQEELDFLEGFQLKHNYDSEALFFTIDAFRKEIELSKFVHSYKPLNQCGKNREIVAHLSTIFFETSSEELSKLLREREIRISCEIIIEMCFDTIMLNGDASALQNLQENTDSLKKLITEFLQDTAAA